MNRLLNRLSSSQIIILGFAGIILIGAILLMLPISTKSGTVTPLLDALFTSTSAVCVTGLVVKDTATYWSTFGQAVILLLIQIGGMGVVTMACAISLASGKVISLKQRSTMQEAISAHKVGGIVRLTGFILRTTICIELIGAILLSIPFCKDFGLIKGLWYGFFHSISAFCNAGFDLMGVREQFSSLTYYAANPIVNVVIPSLIVIGGIGFLTWDDIAKYRHHLHKYSMQSKIVIMVTFLLILIPSIYFFFFEFENLPFLTRVCQSVFQTVTTRTAGFNTADLSLLSETGIFLMIVLMLIGGSPGSTAGGMKTTTFAILISTSFSVFRRKEYAHFFKRRISDGAIRNAITIFMMFMNTFLISGCIISHIEGLPLLSCLYECASAIATVGLTVGITTELGAVSRCILILLMYIGRVGGLTLIFSTVSTKHAKASKYPQGKVTIG